MTGLKLELAAIVCALMAAVLGEWAGKGVPLVETVLGLLAVAFICAAVGIAI